MLHPRQASKNSCAFFPRLPRSSFAASVSQRLSGEGCPQFQASLRRQNGHSGLPRRGGRWASGNDVRLNTAFHSLVSAGPIRTKEQTGDVEKRLRVPANIPWGRFRQYICVSCPVLKMNISFACRGIGSRRGDLGG